MQTVHSVDQEYWVVGRTRCRCGNAHSKASVISQRVELRPSGPVDILVIRCGRCGNDGELEFDISPFFGKPDLSSLEGLLSDKEQAWRMYINDQLRMEAVVMYLSELAKARDSLAIEYIREAARHFLTKAQSNRDVGLD